MVPDNGAKGWTDFAQAEVKAVKPVPYVPFCDLKIPMEVGYGTLNPDIEKIHQMDQSDKCRRNEWIKYEAVLTALDDVRGAQFAITLDAPGIVEFDLISMIPEDAVSGIFRKDLFEHYRRSNRDLCVSREDVLWKASVWTTVIIGKIQ